MEEDFFKLNKSVFGYAGPRGWFKKMARMEQLTGVV